MGRPHGAPLAGSTRFCPDRNQRRHTRGVRYVVSQGALQGALQWLVEVLRSSRPASIGPVQEAAPEDCAKAGPGRLGQLKVQRLAAADADGISLAGLRVGLAAWPAYIP